MHRDYHQRRFGIRPRQTRSREAALKQAQIEEQAREAGVFFQLAMNTNLRSGANRLLNPFHFLALRVSVSGSTVAAALWRRT